jgi:hypothetical protein
MLLSEELRARKRGRPPGSRNRVRNESVEQPAAFPSDSTSSAVENLEQDAADKKKVKEAAAAIPEIFTPEQVVWCFDAYVAILSFVYSLVLKVDYKAIQDELEFSPEQKEQMAKPFAKICSKYAPSEWAGMTAEIQLVTMLGVWTVASFQRARNVQKTLVEKEKDATRTRPVQSPRPQPIREEHVPA